MNNDENGSNSIQEEEEIQDQFVLVFDSNDNDPVEILLSKDGTLPISSLSHAFPGAHGLKYKNPNTGGKRIVSFDDNKKSFIAPSDGWGGKLFDVIFQPKNVNVSDNLVVVDVKNEPIEKETSNLKRKHNESQENENNNIKVSKQENSLGVKEKINEQVVNEEIKDNSNSSVKEEFNSKNSIKTGNFELPSIVAEKVPSDLIVFGLPYELGDWAFREYFEQFGAVEYEEIKRKPDGTSRGFAFVRMINYVDQIRALSITSHKIGGRECTLKISALDKGNDGGFYDNISIHPRLYVGALNVDIGKERLREFILDHLYRFDRRSAILEIFYPKPFRSFAFLTVTPAIATRELLRQHDFFIDGHYFMLTLAIPKKEEEMTPGIFAPPLKIKSGKGWKKGHQQLNVPPRGPPLPPPGPPDVYWNRGPPKIPSIPPSIPIQQQNKYPPQFIPYGGNNEEYMPPRRTGVSADYILPPRGERSYFPQQKPLSETFNHPNKYPPPINNTYTRKAPSPSYDSREEMFQSMSYGNNNKSNRNDNNYDPWIGESPSTSNNCIIPPPLNPYSSSNISPNDAEAVLNKLPNDAVSTALRMLQSIMTAQQQKERNYNNGRNEDDDERN